MNDSGKQKKNIDSLSFEKKIKDARSSKAKGELIPVNPANVWESIESGLEQHSMEITYKLFGFKTIASLSGRHQVKSEARR